MELARRAKCQKTIRNERKWIGMIFSKGAKGPSMAFLFGGRGISSTVSSTLLLRQMKETYTKRFEQGNWASYQWLFACVLRLQRFCTAEGEGVKAKYGKQQGINLRGS